VRSRQALHATTPRIAELRAGQRKGPELTAAGFLRAIEVDRVADGLEPVGREQLSFPARIQPADGGRAGCAAVGAPEFCAAGSAIGCEDQGFAEGRELGGNGPGCPGADVGNEAGVPMAALGCVGVRAFSRQIIDSTSCLCKGPERLNTASQSPWSLGVTATSADA